MKPLVGVGILNYKRADLTVRCLEHLQKLNWPADRLEIVVVDNASSDDSVDRIREAFPEVKVITSSKNRGFAGGCNLAIRSMPQVDYVALLNNDAFVDPSWLEPLVEALGTGERVGAACSKILFETTFADVGLRCPTFRPVGIDTRDLGVRISSVKVGEEERWRNCHFPEGFWPEESNSVQQAFRWTNGDAVLRVPLSQGEVGSSCTLKAAAERCKPLQVTTGGHTEEFEVCNRFQHFELELRGEPFDLINNAGSELVEFRHAADRGIFQADRGQFDEPGNVFAWCGCSVLLSPEYLADVGLFDERLFLYYEDFDLSWRGQRRGWSYAYVPESTVRHCHAATTGEHSELFNFFVWRNRLLVLVKNGSARTAVREAADLGHHVLANLISDLRTHHLSRHTRNLVRSYLSFLVHLPGACIDRMASGVRNRLAPRKRSRHR